MAALASTGSIVETPWWVRFATGPVPDDLPHVIVITMKRNTNGRILNVRCTCQAQCRVARAYGYFNYDTLGEATSLAGAYRLFDDHVREVTS